MTTESEQVRILLENELLQARVKALEEVLEGFLLYLNDSPEQTIIPDGRITDAATILAEGDIDNRPGKYPAWDQNEAP